MTISKSGDIVASCKLVRLRPSKHSYASNSGFSLYHYLLDTRCRFSRLCRRWIVYLIATRTILFPDLYLFAFSFYLLIYPPVEAQNQGITQFPSQTGVGTVAITFMWKFCSCLCYYHHMDEIISHQTQLRQSVLTIDFLESVDCSSDWIFLLAIVTYWNLLFDLYLLVCLMPRESSDNHHSSHPPPRLPGDLAFLKALLILSFVSISLFPVVIEFWFRARNYLWSRYSRWVPVPKG